MCALFMQLEGGAGRPAAVSAGPFRGASLPEGRADLCVQFFLVARASEVVGRAVGPVAHVARRAVSTRSNNFHLNASLGGGRARRHGATASGRRCRGNVDIVKEQFIFLIALNEIYFPFDRLYGNFAGDGPRGGGAGAGGRAGAGVGARALACGPESRCDALAINACGRCGAAADDKFLDSFPRRRRRRVALTNFVSFCAKLIITPARGGRRRGGVALLTSFQRPF
ncbi:hypothetical protein EVAR_103990_1 [Eumeta japonica]|uniref:Uncharacterized protein n=1 Tax=Eumeta variegata TaxID=151549 RepID=A0A4C1XXW0_EUMVA|nr:hypothetical protein EVAR_103990_1 [Eumeta japonica]